MTQPPGCQTEPHVITATQAGTANYLPATAVARTLTVDPATSQVTAADASRAFAVANPVFTGLVTGVVAGDTITATYASSATATMAIGVYGPAMPEAITPMLIDAGGRLGNYLVTSTNGTLTITAGGSTGGTSSGGGGGGC